MDGSLHVSLGSAAPLLFAAAAGPASWLWPWRSERKRRLGAMVTLLRASDPKARISALEKAHALAPGDRGLLAKLLRAEVAQSPRSGSTPPIAQAMTVWLIRQILALLSDPRTPVRMDAARALRAILSGDPRRAWRDREESAPLATAVASAVELAGGRILSGTPETRVLAIAEMLEAGLRPLVIGVQALDGVQEAMGPLTAALRDRSPRVRQSLCEALAAMGGGRSVELLAPMLQDPSPELRARAAQYLGETKATSAAPQLEELLHDPMPAVRGAAAAALAEVGLESSCGPVLAALSEEAGREDGQETTRAAMIEAVARLAGSGQTDLAQALTDLPVSVARRLAISLERNGAIERWLVERDWGQRADLLTELLGSAAARGVSRPFRDALDSTEEWVRLRAATALGRSQDTAALTAVAALLSDPDAGVRAAAVGALAHSGAPVALMPLARAAADPSRAVSAAAVAGLRQVLEQRPEWRSDSLPADFDLPAGLSEAERALLGAAKDHEETVRLSAAKALGGFASAEAASVLIDVALGDENGRVRAGALEALARGEFPHTQRLLAGALEDRDEVRRARVMTLLGVLGGPAAGRHLLEALRDASPPVREAALAALPRLDLKGLADRLAAELRNPDPRVRAQMAAQLGRARAGEHTDTLAECLADPDEGVRISALVALSGLGRPVKKHRSAVTARLSDPSPRVRDAATSALSALGEAWSEAMETADLLLSGPLSGAGAAALVDMAASGDIGPMLRALSNPRSAESLAAYLAGPGRARLDAVLSSLRRADEPDQMRALGELSQALRQGAAINGYLADLRAIDSGARLMAVEIASLVATPEATAALIEVLGGDPLPEVRIRAANALAGFSDQATEAALTRSRADDPNEAVRRVAELALSRRRDRHPSASAYLSGDAPAPSLPAA